MLRLSKLTDYATVVMTSLAREPERLHTVTELAQTTRLNPPTVSKTLKKLAHDGLVLSVRGAHGGYRLGRAADCISVADIVSAIEGPIALTECAHHSGQCGIEAHCGLRSHWPVINRALIRTLAGLKLADFIHPTVPMVSYEH